MLVVPKIPRCKEGEILTFNKINHIIKRTEYAAKLWNKYKFTITTDRLNPEYFTPSTILLKKATAQHFRYGLSGWNLPADRYLIGILSGSSECFAGSPPSPYIRVNPYDGYGLSGWPGGLEPGTNYGNVIAQTRTSRTAVYRCSDGTALFNPFIPPSDPYYNSVMSASVFQVNSQSQFKNRQKRLIASSTSKLRTISYGKKIQANYGWPENYSGSRYEIPPIQSIISNLQLGLNSDYADYAPNSPNANKFFAYFMRGENSSNSLREETIVFTTKKNFYTLSVSKNWRTKTRIYNESYSELIPCIPGQQITLSTKNYIHPVTPQLFEKFPWSIATQDVTSSVSVSVADFVSITKLDSIKNLFSRTSSSYVRYPPLG